MGQSFMYAENLAAFRTLWQNLLNDDEKNVCKDVSLVDLVKNNVAEGLELRV